MNNLLIRSNDRYSGDSHSFVVKSQEILEGRYILKHAIIPNTLYNVSHNTVFVLQEDGAEKTVMLTAGSYSVAQLASELKTQLDTASAGFNVFTINLLARQGKLNITSSNVFSLWFPDLTTAGLLGLSSLQSEAGTNLTSDVVVQLASPASVGVEIRETDKDNYTNITTGAAGTLYIPIDSAFGFYKSLDDHNFRQTLVFNKARNLTIKIVDTATNEGINLNGGEFELLFSKI